MILPAAVLKHWDGVTLSQCVLKALPSTPSHPRVIPPHPMSHDLSSHLLLLPDTHIYSVSPLPLLISGRVDDELSHTKVLGFAEQFLSRATAFEEKLRKEASAHDRDVN